MNAPHEVIEYRPQATALVSAADILTQVKVVQEVMQAVMKENTHYGIVPGTKKPSLWKPGAEVLCAVFRIADKYHIDDLSTDDSIRYRVTCQGTHQTTGVLMGEGIGECSSNEKKYKWVKAYQPEWDATPENRRRKAFDRDGTLQVRTDPADLANTVLKMAAKRAKIAMTLNVTAASDIFSQDLDELDERLRASVVEENEQTPQLDPKVKADLLASLSEHTGVDDLRDRLKRALKVAQDAGDVEAHKEIKAHGVKLQMAIAAKNVEAQTERQPGEGDA